MFFYLYNTNKCKYFLKSLINKNNESIEDIQRSIHNDNDAIQSTINSLDYNIEQLDNHPCKSTFKQHKINDFFHFYQKILINHREHLIESINSKDNDNNNKLELECLYIASSLKSFNERVRNIKKKLN